MKKILIMFVVFLIVGASAKAQYVKVRVNFPGGVSIGAPGRPPYPGAIWVGPEWVWRGNRYVYIPGYWAKPRKHRIVWIPGHWNYTRKGYRWVPGHWT